MQEWPQTLSTRHSKFLWQEKSDTCTKVKFRVLQETQDKGDRRKKEVIGQTTDPEVVESLLAQDSGTGRQKE
jgi:hypothetical protein